MTRIKMENCGENYDVPAEVALNGNALSKPPHGYEISAATHHRVPPLWEAVKIKNTPDCFEI